MLTKNVEIDMPYSYSVLFDIAYIARGENCLDCKSKDCENCPVAVLIDGLR